MAAFNVFLKILSHARAHRPYLARSTHEEPLSLTPLALVSALSSWEGEGRGRSTWGWLTRQQLVAFFPAAAYLRNISANLLLCYFFPRTGVRRGGKFSARSWPPSTNSVSVA